MSSTSQKHRNFIAEPMGEKSVTDLAGIGPVLGDKLSKKGFDKVSLDSFNLNLNVNCYAFLQAYVVLGQFLVLRKNKELFIDWLKDETGANSKQSGDCHQCLSDWCEEFL